jgi:hypothetical protein
MVLFEYWLYIFSEPPFQILRDVIYDWPFENPDPEE